MNEVPARCSFRILTRIRGGYGGGMMYDVQLQAVATGNLLWAQTFTDHRQAVAFETTVHSDLQELDDRSFRRKYGVPTGA